MEHKNTELTKKVLLLIEENLQHPHCLAKVEDVILVNDSNYYALFTEEMGLTPDAYIIKQRLKHAEKLLEQKELSLKDISKAIGLNGYFEFTQLFKHFNGMSPASYRNQILKTI
ncbi:AraC family transcriptional regulator [Solibacillus sp. FSL H8-0523]|uniref:AraC family transcriptional regulator n=1 Tax=Solibacillus sp. FSL H8-0523 TaxID=2954511 RepID=UPI0031017B40